MGIHSSNSFSVEFYSNVSYAEAEARSRAA
jgi:hypothetical protein